MAQRQARAAATKVQKVSCKDCFFGCRNLCALTEGPCPTWRPDDPSGLVPPRQPSLLPRSPSEATAQPLAQTA